MRKIIQSEGTKLLGAVTVLALLAVPGRALAQGQSGGDVIADVKVSGNQTVPIEKIMRYVYTRRGMAFNKSKIYEDVTRLLDSRLFRDVKQESEKTSNGVIVTFIVNEFPSTVLEVIYRNVHHISQKDLEAMMPTIRKGARMDPAANIKACRDIQDYLKLAKGRYWANVSLEEGYKVTDQRVIFNISEGPVLRVRRTEFIGGNELASAARQRTQIGTSRSFFGLGGTFNESQVDADVKKLEDYFQANGYRFAKVTRELIFSQDYSQVDVIFHIHEGKRTRVGDISVKGSTHFSEKELLAIPRLRKSEYYSKGQAEADAKNIAEYIGWRGLKVDVKEETFDVSQGIVQVQFEVQEKSPSKVGDVYIVGNEVTQDRVIRRLLGLYPGQTLRYPELKISENNLIRSNLFDNKSEETRPTITVIERPDDGFGVYKDIMVRVKETQTGSFMIGAGINSNAGLTGNIVLNERNFDIFRWPTSLADIWEGRAWRGAGQEFRIEAVPGTVVQRYTASIREPFLFDRPISMTNSIYYYQRFYNEDTEERLGYRVSFAYTLPQNWMDMFANLFSGPVLANLREARYALSVNAGMRIEDVGIFNIGQPNPPVDYTSVQGYHFVIAPRVGITYDTRDSFLRPTQGGIVDASFEMAFGSYTYPLANLTASRYFTTFQRADGSGKQVIALRSQVSWAGDNTPVYDRYYAGGYGSIRGFEFRGVGPQVNNFEVGGNFMFLNSIEYQVPVLANDSLYFVGFIDSGTVESNVSIHDYRVSAGVGMRLSVPMLGPLPLALDFGFPIVAPASDHRQIVSFSVGFFH